MVIIMWLVKSKPISSNITMPTTSCSHILCHRKCVMTGVNQYVFAQITTCTMRYDVIYHPIPISSQYLKTWRVDSPNLTLYATCAVTVFPCLFLFLRLKERQINIGRIDLVWAMPSGESRETLPDTNNIPYSHETGHCWVLIGSLRYRDYGLRLRLKMLLRMIQTTWLFIFPT